jgi:hypothetical protein
MQQLNQRDAEIGRELALLAAERAITVFQDILRETRLYHISTQAKNRILKNCFRLEFLILCQELSDIEHPNQHEVGNHFLSYFAREMVKAFSYPKRQIPTLIDMFLELSEEAVGKSLYTTDANEIPNTLIGALAALSTPKIKNPDVQSETMMNILFTMLENANNELDPAQRQYAALLECRM